MPWSARPGGRFNEPLPQALIIGLLIWAAGGMDQHEICHLQRCASWCTQNGGRHSCAGKRWEKAPELWLWIFWIDESSHDPSWFENTIMTWSRVKVQRVMESGCFLYFLANLWGRAQFSPIWKTQPVQSKSGKILLSQSWFRWEFAGHLQCGLVWKWCIPTKPACNSNGWKTMIRFFMFFPIFIGQTPKKICGSCWTQEYQESCRFSPSEVGHIHALKSPRLRAARWAISHPTVTLFVTARVCLRGFESLHDWGDNLAWK